MKPAIKIGTRVRLTLDIENYPFILAKAGLTGTLVEKNNDDGFWLVKLDKYFEDLDEWDNCLQVGVNGENPQDYLEALPRDVSGADWMDNRDINGRKA